MRNEELAKCTPTVGSARTKFFPLFSHAARHFISLVPHVNFFLTFSLFSQAKRFFILFPIVSQIQPHLGQVFFPLEGYICYFDFVLADGSRQWGTPKLLNSLFSVAVLDELSPYNTPLPSSWPTIVEHTSKLLDS